jgi:hypothetical protein
MRPFSPEPWGGYKSHVGRAGDAALGFRFLLIFFVALTEQKGCDAGQKKV